MTRPEKLWQTYFQACFVAGSIPTNSVQYREMRQAFINGMYAALAGPESGQPAADYVLELETVIKADIAQRLKEREAFE